MLPSFMRMLLGWVLIIAFVTGGLYWAFRNGIDGGHS